MRHPNLPPPEMAAELWPVSPPGHCSGLVLPAHLLARGITPGLGTMPVPRTTPDHRTDLDATQGRGDVGGRAVAAGTIGGASIFAVAALGSAGVRQFATKTPVPNANWHSMPKGVKKNIHALCKGSCRQAKQWIAKGPRSANFQGPAAGRLANTQACASRFATNQLWSISGRALVMRSRRAAALALAMATALRAAVAASAHRAPCQPATNRAQDQRFLGVILGVMREAWSGQQDSNLRPPAPKTGASRSKSRAIPTVPVVFTSRRVNGLVVQLQHSNPVHEVPAASW